VSTWVEGKVYDYYGKHIRCMRRWFDGALEMVSFLPWPQHSDRFPSIVAEYAATAVPFERTARTLAPCVRPPVTETLGGVLAPWACEHEFTGRVVADAGPYAGRVCCSGCGVATWTGLGGAERAALLDAGPTTGPTGTGPRSPRR
jgi:hypothetical protein